MMIIITSTSKYSKGSVGIITSKIFKKIDDNNYIKKYLKGLVGIIRSKILKII